MSGREERDPPTSGQFIKPLKLPVNTLQKELSEFGNRLLQTLHLPSAASVLLWLMRDTVYGRSAREPLRRRRAFPGAAIPGAAIPGAASLELHPWNVVAPQQQGEAGGKCPKASGFSGSCKEAPQGHMSGWR